MTETMELRPLLEACPPREIEQAGDQYAASLIGGLGKELATAESAAEFLEATYVTKAMSDFVRMAMDRVVRGRESTSPAVYQLNSRYGGGKTHSLLLLAAAAKHPGLPYWEGFGHDGERVGVGAARVVAFDGIDYGIGGVRMDDGSRARSLAGHLLHQLGGAEALGEFAEGDELFGDPGAEAFRRLIGDEPVVIVIDELVQYINRVDQLVVAGKISADGVLTTLSALAKAVIDSPRAVLVITTPEEAHGLLSGAEGAGAMRADAANVDAMHADAVRLLEMLERINSQLARVMHPLAPSESEDLPEILRRRLFKSVDEAARVEAAKAYAEVAGRNGRAASGLGYKDFEDAYPFHPRLLRVITGHLAANRNFQRVRGTLRLLGNALQVMKDGESKAMKDGKDGENGESDGRRVGSKAAVLHTYHLTLREPRIRDELVNRLGFSELDPAIETDIVGPESTAGKVGNPLAEAVATTMLLGTLAPRESSGLYADEIADALLSPEHSDSGVIGGAIEQFLARSIYVDDSPDTQQKRFSKDANVMKELLEAKSVILADTAMMSDLLRKAIGSAYAPGREGGFELCIFPSPQSNVPDNVDRAVLGIVNPDFWNFRGAGEPGNRMSNQELVDLHRRKSGGGDGDAGPRNYPNNALLLAAHDADMGRIRDDLATLEAAERLLRNRARPLSEPRRATIEKTRAECEKNATLGIQNKFTHLFCAGNAAQLQWPEANSHLERRTLESITDAVGKGQESILRALGERVLRGRDARLNLRVWARMAPIANDQGSTLGGLRDYFARTPAERIVIDEGTWRALVGNGIGDGALHVVTRNGEIGPTSGYDASWQVWAKGFEPKPVETVEDGAPPPATGGTGGTSTGGAGGGGGASSGTAVGSAGGGGGGVISPARLFRFDSSKMQPGRSAVAELRQFMETNEHGWEGLLGCEVKGVSQSLADQIASIAQGSDEGVMIDLRAEGGSSQGGRVRLSIEGAAPSEYKEYAQSARRILERAGIEPVDLSVRMDAAAAERTLDKLNVNDEARIIASFRQG